MTPSRELLARYEADPVLFSREVLRFDPWSGQRDILEAVRDHDRVAVKTCNAGGKTAAASTLVPWWLAGGPGSIVVTTATTERQVKRVLWREVHQRYRAARGFFAGATLTDTEILLAPDWFAVGLSVDETESMQGFHGSRMLVIVDEASGVDERIFEAIDGVLAGGHAKLLLIGNPLRTSGTFFDAFGKDRDEWKTLTISAYDTPNLTGEDVSREARRKLVSRRWVERAARRGEASSEYRVRVLAEFPSESEDTVVSLGDLELAHAARFEPGFPLVIGVDVARFGSDKTVLALREGNSIRVVRSYQGRDLMRTAGEVTDLARAVQARRGRKPTIVVDDVGLGGGVTDRLRELDEFRVVDYNAGRRATSRGYPNRRSEMWFAVADLLPVLDLDPADEELAADLLAPTYSLASDARRVVEAKANTKKRLRRSPDRADAVILTLVVDPPVALGKNRRPRRTTSVPRGRIDARSRTAPGRAGGRVRAESSSGRAGGRFGRDSLADALHALGVDTVGNGRYLGVPAHPAAPATTVAHDASAAYDPQVELDGLLGGRR